MTIFDLGDIIGNVCFIFIILCVLKCAGKENRIMLFAAATPGYLFASNLLSSVFCLFLVIYMRVALENQNNSHARFVFKKFIFYVLLCLGADMLSYAFDTQTFFAAKLLSHLSMFFSVLLTVYVGYLWNRFFDVVFHIHDNSPNRRILYAAPVAVTALMLVLNWFTGWFFYMGESNVYVRGPIAIVSFILQYVLFGALIFRAVFFKFGVKTLRYSKLRNSFIWIGVLSLSFGLLQIIAGGKIALHCFGMTASIFIMFSRFQDDQITNDLLTGLNNRYALDTYIEDKIKIYHDGMHGRRQLYLVMMDVNYFKRINDVHGHVEGDKALKTVATTLKKIGSDYGSELFVARFGGDEFSAVFESDSERKVAELCNEIKDTLRAETEDFKYLLTIGAGYAVYTGRTMSLASLYDRADKALYDDKDRMKSEGRS